jgi:predicted nucleic acid-binding protein
MAVVDASVILAAFLKSDKNHRASISWLVSLVKAGNHFSSPTIILSEIAAPLGRAYGQPGLAIRLVKNLLSAKYCNLFPVTIPLASRSAVIAADYKIRGCDSIYVALAVALNEDLITWDRQQRERAKNLINAYHL